MQGRNALLFTLATTRLYSTSSFLTKAQTGIHASSLRHHHQQTLGTLKNRHVTSPKKVQSSAINKRRQTFSTYSSVNDCIGQEAAEEVQKIIELFSSHEKTSVDNNRIQLPLVLQTNDEVSSHMKSNYDAILFDCDGVLYRGSNLIPNVSHVIKNLIKDEKKIFFITNNAGQNRSEMREKLSRLLGIPELTEEQMITSSYSCARYLQKQLLANGDTLVQQPLIHVIGTSGLREEIRNAGFDLTDDLTTSPSSMSREELSAASFSTNRPIAAVAIGLDTSFTYHKLATAVNLLHRNPTALLIATNRDAFDIVGGAGDARRILPGNGSIVSSIEVAAGREAVNVGKPSRIVADLVAEEHGLDPARSIVIGDRLDTDIAFGLKAGMGAGLVMSGVTDVERVGRCVLQGGQEEMVPTVIFAHVGMLA